ncbi:hypothetical protein AB7813_08915 [Tardiphaga sp. 20_F10_N6_6]|uniref:hypothetical protein n=1 Tax=Tardiphaga sp. 20_F10_N6_6 TaxID=3240788 RepID=UPI003F8B456A
MLDTSRLTFALRSRITQPARSNPAACQEDELMISAQTETTVTHCNKGLHELTEESRFQQGNGWGCRTCWRERTLARGGMPLANRAPTYDEWKAGAKRSCKNGHALETEADFRMPTEREAEKGRRSVLCRTCLAATAKKCKVEANFSEQTIRRIVALIVDFGFTKHNLTGRRGRNFDGKHQPRFTKGVTDGTRFNNWLRKNPKMAAVLEKQLEINRQAHKQEGMAKRRKDKLRISANSNVVDIIDAALPKWLDRDQRSDITTAMYLALADGHLKKKDIKARVGEYVRANNKLSQNIGRYGFNSLDAPMGDDNPASRIERLTDADRLWQSA